MRNGHVEMFCRPQKQIISLKKIGLQSSLWPIKELIFPRVFQNTQEFRTK